MPPNRTSGGIPLGEIGPLNDASSRGTRRMREVLGEVVRQLPLVLLCGLVAATLGAAYAQSGPSTTFTARAIVRVDGDAFSTPARLQTAALVASSAVTRARVARQLDLRDQPQLGAIVLPETNAIQLSARSSSRTLSKQIVDTAAQIFVDDRKTARTSEVRDQIARVERSLRSHERRLEALGEAVRNSIGVAVGNTVAVTGGAARDDRLVFDRQLIERLAAQLDPVQNAELNQTIQLVLSERVEVERLEAYVRDLAGDASIVESARQRGELGIETRKTSTPLWGLAGGLLGLMCGVALVLSRTHTNPAATSEWLELAARELGLRYIDVRAGSERDLGRAAVVLNSYLRDAVVGNGPASLVVAPVVDLRFSGEELTIGLQRELGSLGIDARVDSAPALDASSVALRKAVASDGLVLVVPAGRQRARQDAVLGALHDVAQAAIPIAAMVGLSMGRTPPPVPRSVATRADTADAKTPEVVFASSSSEPDGH